MPFSIQSVNSGGGKTIDLTKKSGYKIVSAVVSINGSGATLSSYHFAADDMSQITISNNGTQTSGTWAGVVRILYKKEN